MAHAEKCPVCDGIGFVYVPNEVDVNGTAVPTYNNYQRQCNGCHGKGWITVPDDH